jgi:hypothetical protein
MGFFGSKYSGEDAEELFDKMHFHYGKAGECNERILECQKNKYYGEIEKLKAIESEHIEDGKEILKELIKQEYPLAHYYLAIFYQMESVEEPKKISKALKNINLFLETFEIDGNESREFLLGILKSKMEICDELNDKDGSYECHKTIRELEAELKNNGRKVVDKNGYERGKSEHSDLIHRQNAYKYIYKPNRDKYPLPFSEYVVHHKDGNKLNNHSKNLEIFTKAEHEALHKFGNQHNPVNSKKG